MADDIANAVAADMIAEDSVVAAAPEAEQTAPEEPVETDIPSYEADTEGIEDLLSEPDDDLDIEDPDDPEPVLVQTDEYDDPEVTKLKAQLVKAQKQLNHQTQLRAQDNEKKWSAEAARRFPLADVDEIHATSRRSFLRKAQEQHDRYNRKLEPVLSKLDALRTEVIAEARAEGKETAQHSWGKPTVAPQVAQVESAEAVIDPRKFKTLHDLTLARMRAGQGQVAQAGNELANQ